ncbi:hypothetical protein [Diaphorobacter sp. LR2014-1]|uniref:hypothetical protein n=1 Tax=Diaphorobacter sp. LR2014-1 TaxID=1933219 RepID=UPI0011AF775F|nr:hypothetical protein [Diaphorobacter sp. LR2014-1]
MSSLKTGSLLTVFARREPTKNAEALALGKIFPGSTAKMTDVVIYRDSACTNVMGRFPPHHSGRPRRKSKKVNLSCWVWRLQWKH